VGGPVSPAALLWARGLWSERRAAGHVAIGRVDLSISGRIPADDRALDRGELGGNLGTAFFFLSWIAARRLSRARRHSSGLGLWWLIRWTTAMAAG